MTDHKGILVCADATGGRLAGMSAELLSAGARLSAQMEEPLIALITGTAADSEAAAQAVSMGAHKVLVTPSSDLTPEQYAILLNAVYSANLPAVIFMAHGDMGRDAAPRLAAKVGAAVTMDCTGVEIAPTNRELLVTKPVYGGNAVAEWASSYFPHVITLRPGSVKAAEADISKKGEVVAIEIALDAGASRTRLLQMMKDPSGGVKLEDARIVVAGGAGIGGEEGLKMLHELAQVLGGVVGVTRVPCDLNWVPMSMEIGQTGHIVSPDLYIAVGISGAPQHITGCIGSKVIITINRDPEANMFRVSNFGVVGDYRQILPPFIKGIKALKAGK